MSKKFFSLIKSGGIHAAPNKKVIPSSEIEELMRAKELLVAVEKEAMEYREEVAVECELLKEEAEKRGYEAGFQKWAEHIAAFEKRMALMREEFSRMLAPIALKAAQKIVGEAFKSNEELIFKIVENAIKPVLQHKRVTIYVNRDDLQFLERHRSDLKELFEGVEVLSIRERSDVAKGGCVVETEGGIINARLENQWAVLERAFEKLFTKKE